MVVPVISLMIICSYCLFINTVNSPVFGFGNTVNPFSFKISVVFFANGAPQFPPVAAQVAFQPAALTYASDVKRSVILPLLAVTVPGLVPLQLPSKGAEVEVPLYIFRKS